MKKLELNNVYEAYTNSDLTEGRGHKVTIGYFVNKIDAEKAAVGKGVMGYNAHVTPANVKFVVFESYEEYEAEHMENVRKKSS